MVFRGIPLSPHYDLKLDPAYDYYKYFHRGAFVALSFKYPEIINARFTSFDTELVYHIEYMTGINHKELRGSSIPLE